MTLFVFGAILAVVGVSAGVFLGGYLAERNTQKRNAPPAPPPQPVAPAEAQPTERRRFWFPSGNQNDLGQQFQTWAGHSLEDEELRTWIGELSKEQVRALTDQLATFCSSLGFELQWLTGQRLAGNPELEQSARGIVERYCAACWHATIVQGDLQQFKRLLDLVDQPFSREYKAITQKLYTDLVRRGVAQAMPPELTVAPEQERQQHIAQSMKEIAGANWAILMEAFIEVQAAEGAQKEKTEKEPWHSGIRRAVRLRSAKAPAATIDLTAQPATQGEANGV